MKKSEQIKALQAECDRLAAERDAYRQAHNTALESLPRFPDVVVVLATELAEAAA